ncbi:hypothetical protein H5U35_06075 [Candidatus Aerophobetes bacterium]|nr:hypothetical protein [Candidatus Aerophobetes bacterium]
MELVRGPKRVSNRGFSVVEIIIAFFIALIILFVIGVVYVTSERSFRFGRDAVMVDEELRGVMDLMVKDMREAEQVTKSDDTVTLVIPSDVASEDIVYVYVPEEKRLERHKGAISQTVASNIIYFDIEPGTTVTVTISSTRPWLEEPRTLSSKVTLRNAGGG